MAPTPTTPPPAITRTVAKGGADFVNEIFTDAAGATIRGNIWTRVQLQARQAQIASQQASALKDVTDMLTLLG